MQRVKLDRIDRQILSDLQAEGRMTNVELAQRAGISAPPCLRRVRALEQAGYIKGYHAQLDQAQLGYAVTVFAHVGLNSQAEADLSAFEALVREWPEVRECHMLAGETDFLLRVVAKDWDAYQPKVANVKSALAIRSAKNLPGVPIAVDGDKPAQPPLTVPAGLGT
jgi:DNA-binding Lrp family transcriptional regulator